MSRQRILGGIAATLEATTARTVRAQIVADRLAKPPAHARPQRTSAAAGDRAQQFSEVQTSLGNDVIEIAMARNIPSAIAGYLQALGLPQRLRRGDDAWLAGLPWHAAALDDDSGPAVDTATVGLSRASAGAAETGTLLLASGPDNPVTLAFLPETHIVVLRTSAIVGSYEEACAMVLAEGGGALPRTLNLITGASRTGDIGGKIVKGAHGPRRLAVVLVAGDE
jgi:L-lactate dehydrogenase complex protein LldG